MNLISSDTSVWIDFVAISRLPLPFLLPYTYLMNQDAIEQELLFPHGLANDLIQLGLKSVELTIEEFQLAERYISLHHRLSVFDCTALAIAKERNITLLTGDGTLRRVAEKEKVKVFGTIGVLDQLYEQKHIEKSEYVYCLEQLLAHNGREIRLPQNALQSRIEKCKLPKM